MERDGDEDRVSLYPLDPLTALRGLLKVKPGEAEDEGDQDPTTSAEQPDEADEH
jgi:hypothetical protein